MTVIDIVILVILAAGMILGYRKGFFKQLSSVVGLVAGLFVARALYVMVGEQLAPHIGTSESVAQVLAFLLIWAVVPMIIYVAATMLTKALDIVHLGILNRFGGALLGMLLCLLWIGLLIHILQFVDTQEAIIGKEMKEASFFYSPIREFSDVFFPAIKDMTKQIIK